jgi:hypothetical protein
VGGRGLASSSRHTAARRTAGTARRLGVASGWAPPRNGPVLEFLLGGLPAGCRPRGAPASRAWRPPRAPAPVWTRPTGVGAAAGWGGVVHHVHLGTRGIGNGIARTGPLGPRRSSGTLVRLRPDPATSPSRKKHRRKTPLAEAKRPPPAERNPAASYSPRDARPKYHRRWRA